MTNRRRDSLRMHLRMKVRGLTVCCSSVEFTTKNLFCRNKCFRVSRSYADTSV
jgi:hypothetical protein